MNIPSVFYSLLCFFSNRLPTSSAGKIIFENPRQFCGEDFKWNEDLKGVKLLDDCMLLKSNLILNDAVMQITNKTECINSIYLVIDDVPMWTKAASYWKSAGRPLTSREIRFKNGLRKDLRQMPVKVTFTAINALKTREHFVSQFYLDSKKCPERQNGQKDTVLPIIAGVGTIILLVAVVTLVVWKKKRGKGAKEANNFDTDENHTYGTYSRGWEEEGEYGDGDKVYVSDSNDYYA